MNTLSSVPVTEFVGDGTVAGVAVRCAVIYPRSDAPVRLFTASEIAAMLTGTLKSGLDRFLRVRHVQPYLSARLRDGSLDRATVRFRNAATRKLTYGYPAGDIVELCESYVAARAAGVIGVRHTRFAQRAGNLLAAIARAGGTDAFVDRRSGYERVRKDIVLARSLGRTLGPEIRPCVEMLPGRFFSEMFRLNGWPYDDNNIRRRTSAAGRMTNEIILERFAPGELAALWAREEAGTETETEGRELEPNPDYEQEPEFDPEFEPTWEPDLEFDPDSGSAPDFDPTVGLIVGQESDHASDPDFDSTIDLTVDPTVDPAIAPTVYSTIDPDLDFEPDPELDPGVNLDLDPDSDGNPDLEFDSDLALDPDPDSERDSEFDSDLDPDSGLDFEPDSDFDPTAGADPGSDSDLDFYSAPDSGFDSGSASTTAPVQASGSPVPPTPAVDPAELREYLSNVAFLMRVAPNWRRFREMLRRALTSLS